MLVRFALWLLQRSSLSLEERNLCTGILLEKVDALPISAIIQSSDEGLLVNGQLLDIEKLRVLRDRATSALDNQALTVCRDQVRWVAFKSGLATGLSADGLLFYRAAVWYHEELTKHLELFAQKDQQLALSRD